MSLPTLRVYDNDSNQIKIIRHKNTAVIQGMKISTFVVFELGMLLIIHVVKTILTNFHTGPGTISLTSVSDEFGYTKK